MTEYPTGNDERIECATCGRKFVSEALHKHQKVCKKVFVQKRKVFDVKKVRQQAIIEEAKANGGGISTDTYSRPAPARPGQALKRASEAEKALGGQSKKAKWKAQSEMFR
jgi:zinc-finger of a C2HC-type